MSERTPRPPEDDPSWTDDLLLGEAVLLGERRAIRLRLHQAQERYHRRDGAELVPLSEATGERLYVHAKPYLLVPDITLAVELSPRPRSADAAIGHVVGSDWTGMRHLEIGQAQAWYYPSDRLLLLWECFLDDRYRKEEPEHDDALTAVWTGFERVLRERFPQATQLVTPSWEDLYERAGWQAFLHRRGYQSFTQRAFRKELPR